MAGREITAWENEAQENLQKVDYNEEFLVNHDILVVYRELWKGMPKLLVIYFPPHTTQLHWLVS